MKIEIVNEIAKKPSDTILRLVRVPAGFGCEELLVGETPVTEAQWAEVMGGEAERPNYPKVNVSALDAEEFCEKLSEQTGMEFRLPTELEQARCLGIDPPNLTECAVFDENLTKIKTKFPNEYELYDVRGLVWEWTAEEGEGEIRRLRGGSWYYDVGSCRSANRLRLGAGDRHLDVGFRVVVVRPPSTLE